MSPLLGPHHIGGILGQDPGPPPSVAINFSKFPGTKYEAAEASGESQADSDSFSPHALAFQFPKPATMGGALGSKSTIRKVSATPTPCATPPDLSVPRKRPSVPSGSRSSGPPPPAPPPRNPRRVVGPRGADRASSLGWTASSSNRGSTARKGAMMQNPAAVLAGPSSRYSPWPSGSTGAGAGALGVAGGLGRPPRLGRFRSRSSVASSQRYADATEDGESLERQSRSTGVEGEVEHGEDLVLAGGAEAGVDRRWERSESPSVLMAYGTSKDAWKARASGLESGQGVGGSTKKEEKGVLLGEVGKKEVSVSPGIRGSKSFEGEKAFL